MIGLIAVAGVSIGASIGYLCGTTIDRPSWGLWLGALLGPLGWLLVLIPTSTTGTSDISGPDDAPEAEAANTPWLVSCPNGHSVPGTNKFCPVCGAQL